MRNIIRQCSTSYTILKGGHLFKRSKDGKRAKSNAPFGGGDRRLKIDVNKLLLITDSKFVGNLKSPFPSSN
jgi:hypothetical protein